MPMTDGQLASLPAYARNEVRHLRRELEAARAALEQQRRPSTIHLARPQDTMFVCDPVQAPFVRFTELDTPDASTCDGITTWAIDARVVCPGALELQVPMGLGTIIVEPRVTNTVHVRSVGIHG